MTNAYQAAHETVALFDLSARAKIEVAGRDAREFLNNLCTQDVKNLSLGATCEAFLTTSKARVLAHVWIMHRANDVLWLDATAGSAEKILHHLNHYLISERAELTDRTAEFAMLRLVGPHWEPLLATLAITPERRHHWLALDGCDLFCPATEAPALQQRLLDAGAVLGTQADYDLLRIDAGLPVMGSDIGEDRLAVEVNRTAQAICYTKGCYLGQETIVMARDRGQVNRLLMGIAVNANQPDCQSGLPSGAKLFRDNQEVGQVTSSVFSPRLGQVIALAYLRRGNWDASTELIVEPATDGRTAIVCPLPFTAAR